MFSARVAGRRQSAAGAVVFVWGVWLVLSVSVLHFVRTYGVDFPYYDEWEMVPAITGQQPVTLSWLWSQHNEHRMFLGRVIYLGVERLGGFDFRAGAVFDACVLSALAAVLIGFTRRFRGRTTYPDAFFPLLMLHWGQAENLILSFQVQFVASSALAIIVLLLLLTRDQMRPRQALALGLCTVLFPLLGGTGLALTPALAICVFLAGCDVRTAEYGRGWTAVGVWMLGVLAIALTAYYFVDYQRPLKHPHSDSAAATLNGAMQFLTIGGGTAAKTAWPVTKYAVLVLIGATLGALARTVAARSDRAPTALRLLLFLASLCSLAVGISWARSALSPVTMFSSRYATLAAPFLCAIYLAWEVVNRAQLRRVVQVGLFLFTAVMLIPNRDQGMQEGILFRDLRANIVTDLQAGVPAGELVNRYYSKMYYGGPDVLAERMHALHARGIGIFKDLRE
jgi:hypothetical protein